MSKCTEPTRHAVFREMVLRDGLTPLFRHGDQRFDHSLPLAKGTRNWDTKVVDDGTQGLCFEGIPWEFVLTGHDCRGGDGGGSRMMVVG